MSVHQHHPRSTGPGVLIEVPPKALQSNGADHSLEPGKPPVQGLSSRGWPCRGPQHVCLYILYGLVVGPLSALESLLRGFMLFFKFVVIFVSLLCPGYAWWDRAELAMESLRSALISCGMACSMFFCPLTSASVVRGYDASAGWEFLPLFTVCGPANPERSDFLTCCFPTHGVAIDEADSCLPSGEACLDSLCCCESMRDAVESCCPRVVDFSFGGGGNLSPPAPPVEEDENIAGPTTDVQVPGQHTVTLAPPRQNSQHSPALSSSYLDGPPVAGYSSNPPSLLLDECDDLGEKSVQSQQPFLRSQSDQQFPFGSSNGTPQTVSQMLHEVSEGGRSVTSDNISFPVSSDQRGSGTPDRSSSRRLLPVGQRPEDSVLLPGDSRLSIIRTSFHSDSTNLKTNVSSESSTTDPSPNSSPQIRRRNSKVPYKASILKTPKMSFSEQSERCKQVSGLDIHGSLLATANGTGFVSVWHLKTQELLLSIKINAFKVSWSPDGRYLAVPSASSSGSFVHLYEYPSGQEVSKIKTKRISAADTVQWSCDGNFIAVSGDAQSLNGNQQFVTIFGNLLQHPHADKLREIATSFNGSAPLMAWSPLDAHLIAVVMNNSILEVINVDSGDIVRTVSCDSPITALTWSAPQPSLIAVGVEARCVKLFNFDTGTTMRDVTNLRVGVKWIRWCPLHGDYIAINDGALRVLDISEGQELCEVPMYSGSSGGAFVWSPFRNTIVTPEQKGLRLLMMVGFRAGLPQIHEDEVDGTVYEGGRRMSAYSLENHLFLEEDSSSSRPVSMNLSNFDEVEASTKIEYV